MYKDDGAALRARLEAIEAELNAEVKRREAAEADAAAARARVQELELLLSRSPQEKPPRRVTPALYVLVGTALIAGLGLFAVLLLASGDSDDPKEARSARSPSPSTPSPELTKLLVTAAGKPGPRPVSQVELMQLQRLHRAALRACYVRALRRNRSLTEVRATVRVTLTANGTVSQVDVDAPDPALQECVGRVISRWRLPPIGAQSFSFPIIFRGS